MRLFNGNVGVRCLRMTASRLMFCVFVSSFEMLFVWNWRTGNVVRVTDPRRFRFSLPSLSQVLKRSSAEDSFPHSPFDFLDEFRLVAYRSHSTDEGVIDLVIYLTRPFPNSHRIVGDASP